MGTRVEVASAVTSVGSEQGGDRRRGERRSDASCTWALQFPDKLQLELVVPSAMLEPGSLEPSRGPQDHRVSLLCSLQVTPFQPPKASCSWSPCQDLVLDSSGPSGHTAVATQSGGSGLKPLWTSAPPNHRHIRGWHHQSCPGGSALSWQVPSVCCITLRS